MMRPIFSVVVASLTIAAANRLPAQTTTVIRAARMITIASPAVVRDAVIVVTGDKIVAAGTVSGVSIPAGAKVIDLGDVTLLPGFIDAHTHIAGRTLGDPKADDASAKDYPGFAAI